jgi:hypothetical protein
MTFVNKVRKINNASTMERRKQELRNKKNSTLRKFGEKLKSQTLERKTNFCKGESCNSQQSKTVVKKINSGSHLFIGARGVVLRTCLDSTVARFPGDACPLRRSEGDVFY